MRLRVVVGVIVNTVGQASVVGERDGNNGSREPVRVEPGRIGFSESLE